MMHDGTERGHEAELGLLGIVEVEGLDAWTVRVLVPSTDGVTVGWAPYVFWSRPAAESWLVERLDLVVRPAVRDCDGGPNELAFAAVVDETGTELLVSEPMSRVRAAGVAALFAAEFRARGRR